MISSKVGTLLKKNTGTRLWWVKLALALILSNVFFFYLFGPGPQEPGAEVLPSGWVEVKLKAALQTPYERGKKVLLVQRDSRKKLEGLLRSPTIPETEELTVLVRESEAQVLFHFEHWEILPFIRNLTFAPKNTGEQHEIHY